MLTILCEKQLKPGILRELHYRISCNDEAFEKYAECYLEKDASLEQVVAACNNVLTALQEQIAEENNLPENIND